MSTTTTSNYNHTYFPFGVGAKHYHKLREHDWEKNPILVLVDRKNRGTEQIISNILKRNEFSNLKMKVSKPITYRKCWCNNDNNFPNWVKDDPQENRDCRNCNLLVNNNNHDFGACGQCYDFIDAIEIEIFISEKKKINDI